MIPVQYTCNCELLGIQIRHGDHNNITVHSDNQYKCTDCHCTIDNLVSTGILEFCACIVISSCCTMLGLLSLFITTIQKKCSTDINIGSYHIAHSDLQYIY